MKDAVIRQLRLVLAEKVQQVKATDWNTIREYIKEIERLGEEVQPAS